MYVIPLIVLVVLALIAVAWSPIFALIIAVPAFILFLAYVGTDPIVSLLYLLGIVFRTSHIPLPFSAKRRWVGLAATGAG